MHYGATAFSKNTQVAHIINRTHTQTHTHTHIQATITVLKPYSGTIGQRVGFSDTDLKELNMLYKCQSIRGEI
jgi:hypothetical protein